MKRFWYSDTVFSKENTLKSKIEMSLPKVLYNAWMKQKARDELMKKQTELILYGI